MTRLSFGLITAACACMLLIPRTSFAAETTECNALGSYHAGIAIQSQVFDWAWRDFSIRAPDDLPSECDLLLWKDVNYEHNQLREPEALGRRTFRCKKCSKAFKSWEYLDKHIAERHKPTAKKEGQAASVCLAKFCSFIPCQPSKNSATLITTLHEHHPERTRTTQLCREVFARCFPPLKSQQFRQAHEAMEHYFCQGKKSALSAPSSSSSPSSVSGRSGGGARAGVPLSTIFSWFLIASVVVYYCYYYAYIAFAAKKPLVRGGLGYTGGSKRKQPASPENAAVSTPTRLRKIVTSSLPAAVIGGSTMTAPTGGRDKDAFDDNAISSTTV